jgi:hypothetical protein
MCVHAWFAFMHCVYVCDVSMWLSACVHVAHILRA